MSTKIYDAYRIKSGSDYTRGEMIKEIKEMLYPFRQKRFESIYAEEMLIFSDNIRIRDHYHQYDRIQEVLNYTRIMMTSPYKNIQNYINKEGLDPGYVNTSLKTLTLRTILHFRIAGEIEHAEIDPTIMSLEYSFNNSLVLFPISKRYTLMMAFGDDMRLLIYNLSTKRTNKAKAFREKYGLEDYHYQNSTDKPTNISKADWNKRRRDWDIAMPSGIPSKDGMVIKFDFTDHDRFELTRGICVNKNVWKNIKPKNERINKLAQNLAYEDYSKEHNKESSSWHALYKEFKDKIDASDPGIMKNVNKYKEELKDIIVELTPEILQTPMSELYPNYFSVCKQKE